ncbi:MAG TPA: ABC transporter permease [Bryobacteraceae bacterium]|nr:ABC transporter permease [Bryobacteraceae bacterium]
MSKDDFRAVFRYRNLTIGSSIVLILILCGLFAPLLARQDPYAQNLAITFQQPSTTHFFGSDQYGRDVFARIVYGARWALFEVVMSVGMSLLFGVPLGLAAGFFGKRLDSLIMWSTDILYAFPGIVLAILLVAMLGPSLFNTLLAISIFAVPVYTRLSRNLTHTLKRMEFSEAAYALGAGPWRILFTHILRNAFVPLLIQATLTAGDVILSASGLSFLGLGAQPPAAEWGAMMSEGRNFLGVATHLSLFPGLVITIAALGFNMFGDGLRDILDPKFQKRS